MKASYSFLSTVVSFVMLVPAVGITADFTDRLHGNAARWAYVSGVLRDKHDVRTWRDAGGRSIVYYQLLYGSEDDALESLSKLPFEPGWREGKERLLDLAIVHSSQRMVKKLLSLGDPPRRLAAFDKPPLTIAASHGETEIMRILLAAGADINERSFEQSAAHAAVYQSEVIALSMLIDRGIDLSIDRADPGSTNLLSIAIQVDSLEAVSMLVASGFDLNRVGNGNIPLLHIAIREHRSYELVREMLRLGANPCLKDGNGLTAVELARKLYPEKDPRVPPLYEDLFWEHPGKVIQCPSK